MALKNVILGRDVYIYHGTTLIGCAKSVSITGTRKELDVNCTGSSDIEQSELGKAKWTWSIDALWRQADGADIALNKTAYDFINDFEQKTNITIVLKRIGTLVSGDETWTGIGGITNVKLSGSDNSVENFTCSGFFNSFAKAKTA